MQLRMGRDESAYTIPCVIPVSTVDTGVRRLNYGAIVRLRVGDEVTCVVPARNLKHQDLANDARDSMLSVFKRALLADRVIHQRKA